MKQIKNLKEAEEILIQIEKIAHVSGVSFVVSEEAFKIIRNELTENQKKVWSEIEIKKSREIIDPHKDFERACKSSMLFSVNGLSVGFRIDLSLK